MAWYQHRGNYPFITWVDERDVPGKPLAFWNQKRGEYPYRTWTADPPNVESCPLAVWNQKRGELPKESWCKLPDKLSAPWALWHHHRGFYPYRHWIDLPIDSFARRVEIKVIVPSYFEKITLEKYHCKVMTQSYEQTLESMVEVDGLL